MGRHADFLECAGKAQRRRRFDFAETPRRASQSGVALRLPPHSKNEGPVVVSSCGPVVPSLRGPWSFFVTFVGFCEESAASWMELFQEETGTESAALWLARVPV